MHTILQHKIGLFIIGLRLFGYILPIPHLRIPAEGGYTYSIVCLVSRLEIYS